MKSFNIWTEGFAVTGESGKAQYHGNYKGKTFKDAVQNFKDNATMDESSRKCIDVENMNFWGCRFFDNKNDASKSFG